jgi:antitoxin ParD1/3/4
VSAFLADMMQIARVVVFSLRSVYRTVRVWNLARLMVFLLMAIALFYQTLRFLGHKKPPLSLVVLSLDAILSLQDFSLVSVFHRTMVVFNSIKYYFTRKIMQTAEKLSITLPVEMARVIREKVGAGIYSSNSEVIREAVRQWMERNQQLALLDASISKGLSDAQNERIQSIEIVRDQLHQRFEL